ncbi:MAG TPA: phage tail tape measure protein, partial [Acidobacteriota bacterium]|nr:phage tail tape measure protein [Acidobacteriota bacterium]
MEGIPMSTIARGMATELRRLDREFESLPANVRAASSELKRLIDQGQFAFGGSGFGKPFDPKALGGELEAVGTRLTIGLTAPIVAAGTAAVKLGSDFESGFAGVAKTVEASDAELATIRGQLLNLSTEIPATTTQLNRIAAAAGQLGVSVPNITKFTRTISALGVAADGLSVEEAAIGLSRFQNVLGTAQRDVDRTASSLVALGNNFAANEREILQVSQRLAADGRQIRLSEGAVLGFGTALTAAGVGAEAGGSAFSKLFLDIQSEVAKGGEKLDEFAKIAERSTSEFAELFRKDAAEAVTLFIEGLGRMDAASGESTLALETLGLTEVRLRNAILSTANAGDLLRRSILTGNDAFRENTALTREAQQRYATFASQSQVLFQRLQKVAIDVFEKTLRPLLVGTVFPAIDLVLSGIELTVAVLNTLPAPVKRGAVAFGVLLAAVGPLVVGMGGLLTTIGTVSKSLQAGGALATGIDAVTARFNISKAAITGWGLALAGLSIVIVAFKDELAGATAAILDFETAQQQQRNIQSII